MVSLIRRGPYPVSRIPYQPTLRGRGGGRVRGKGRRERGGEGETGGGLRIPLSAILGPLLSESLQLSEQTGAVWASGGGEREEGMEGGSGGGRESFITNGLCGGHPCGRRAPRLLFYYGHNNLLWPPIIREGLAWPYWYLSQYHAQSNDASSPSTFSPFPPFLSS
jgi:hypothetical protein